MLKYRHFRTYEEFNKAKQQCRECEVGQVYNQVVKSEGNTENPDVLIIGECPGREEVEHQKPFVGQSGKILRKALSQAGINSNNSLITNTIPCRPENNKFPKDDMLVFRCRNVWLREEIRLISPNVILLVGSKPLKYTLNLTGITKWRGTIFKKKIKETEKPISVIPTFHPAYLKRKKGSQDGETIQNNFVQDIETAAELARVE